MMMKVSVKFNSFKFGVQNYFSAPIYVQVQIFLFEGILQLRYCCLRMGTFKIQCISRSGVDTSSETTSICMLGKVKFRMEIEIGTDPNDGFLPPPNHKRVGDG